MKDDQVKFEEQSAPLKNTDNAFVQVSKDGSPAMPEHTTDADSVEDQQKTESDNS